MKKIIVLAFITLILGSCAEKKQPKPPISFQKIDLKVFDQWKRVFTLEMDQQGNTTTAIKDPRTKNRAYSFLMNEQILDSISNLARKVDISKIDTLYKDTCDICIGYKIELQKGEKTVKTHVKNIGTNPQIKDLDKLAQLLYNIVRTSDEKPEALKRKEAKK